MPGETVIIPGPHTQPLESNLDASKKNVAVTNSSPPWLHIVSVDVDDNGSPCCNKDDEDLAHSISCLRDLIKGDDLLKKKLHCDLYNDGAFLLKFLRVKKFDLDRTKKMLRDYISLRLKYKIFSTLIPSRYKDMLGAGMHVVLRQRDPEGRKIFLFRISLWNPSVHPLDDIMAGMFLLLEEMARSEETQKKGICFVGDDEGLSLKHFTQFTISKIIMILSTLQGKFPLRCKGLHNVNDPRWLQKLGAFAKPLFSTKLQKRVHFHGTNYSSFHTFFPPSMLPASLGGDLSWDEATDGELFERLYEREEEFYKLANYFSSHS